MALFKKFLHRPEGHAPDLDLQDIISNLNHILNTKKGYGAFQVDLGISDMNELCSRDHIALAIMKEVKVNIEKFEPRIQTIEITRIDDDNPLRLSFKIECTLRSTAQSLHLVFDSVCNSFDLDHDQ